MLSDLTLHLLSEQLARVFAPGATPDDADAMLQSIEAALRQGGETEAEGRGREGSLGVDAALIEDYLRIEPDDISYEVHAWFLERMARDAGWERRIGRDDGTLDYPMPGPPLNRFLATAALLSAGDPGDDDLSVAPIARVLLGSDAAPDERAETISELTDIMLDLCLADLERASPALRELVLLVRREPAVSEYDPVGRALRARAEALGGGEGRLLRDIADAGTGRRGEAGERGDEES